MLRTLKISCSQQRHLLTRASGQSGRNDPIQKKIEHGKTSFQSLTGRDLISFEGYTRNDIFSLLWIATELKIKQFHTLNKGKRISLIWSNPITKASVSDASLQLNASLCCLHEKTFDSSYKFDMLGRALASASDVIFLDCPSWNKSHVEQFATGSNKPVIAISCSETSPALGYAEILTLFEKYGFLRRLIMTYIGPGNNSMLNTYFSLLPTIGAHLRFHVDGDAQVNMDEWSKGIRKATKFNTDMKEMDNKEDALYRAHVLSTCFHNSSSTSISLQDTKEMDLEWTFLQNDYFKGLSVSSEFLTAKGHTLFDEMIQNQSWIIQALVFGHTTDFEPKQPPPRFEGVD